MTKLEQLKRDITSLTPDELAAFREWFEAYDAAAWDAQIENDANAGKFDRLREQALAAHRDGRATEL